MEVSGQIDAAAALLQGQRAVDTSWIGAWLGLKSRSALRTEKKNILHQPGNTTSRFELQCANITSTVHEYAVFESRYLP
jgi:hypothetical protein